MTATNNINALREKYETLMNKINELETLNKELDTEFSKTIAELQKSQPQELITDAKLKSDNEFNNINKENHNVRRINNGYAEYLEQQEEFNIFE